MKKYHYVHFRYQPASDIQGVPHWGQQAVYEGGGFVAQLDINRDVSIQIIQVNMFMCV